MDITKIDKMDVFALVVTFLLALSLLAYIQRPFLEGGTYEIALELKEGISTGAYPSFFSFLTGSMYSSFFGAFNPASLASMLSTLPIIIGLASVTLLYAILRYLRFPIPTSFVSSLLFLTTPLFLLSSIPGVYSPGTLSLVFLAAGILSLLLTNRHIAFSLPSLAFFLLSSAIYPPSSLPAFAVILAFLLGALFEKKSIFPMLISGIPLLLFVLLFTNQSAILQQSTDISSFIQNNRFIFPLAAVSLASVLRKFKEENDLFYFSLLVFTIPIGILFPVGAIFLLAILSANSLGMLFSQSTTRNEKFAIYGVLFFLFSLSFSLGLDMAKALILSIFLSFVGVLLLHLYKFKPSFIPLSITVFLLISSMTTAIFITQSPSLTGAVKGYTYTTIDGQTSEAFGWIGKNTQSNAVVAFLGDKRPFLFISGRGAEKNDSVLASFLVSNESVAALKEKGITHIVVSADIFGESSTLRSLTQSDFNAELYSYYGNASSGGTSYAIFVSPQKEMLIRIVDAQGRFALEDGALRDENGAFISYVPFSQLLLLHPNASLYSSDNPVIRPLNTYNTNAFLLFFGNVEGTKEVYSKGRIKIFEVG
jgi:hypothetical protein